MTRTLPLRVGVLAACLMVVPGHTILSGQAAAITACANRVTGALRVVPSDNCLPSEFPLTLAVPQTEQTVLTVVAAGFDEATSLDIPDLGRLDASCNTLGKASLVLGPIIDGRTRIDRVGGSSQFTTADSIELSQLSPGLGEVETLWVSRENSGVWKVDWHGRHFTQQFGGPQRCVAAAVVTVVK